MHTEIPKRFAGMAPRYTSYPTAPHFHSGVDEAVHVRWLSELAPDISLSLYVHIPYCDRLCWFCGCATKQTNRYDPVRKYLEFIKREIAFTAAKIDGGARVTRLHFGGGSPTMLTPEDLIDLTRHLRSHFNFESDAEICVEIDPTDMTPDKCDAMAEIGLTRASLGVQDFDPEIQKTINRIQTFEETAEVVFALRARGVNSLNLDLLYGLPLQTLETVQRSVELAISLVPDRLALFGYAHVPWIRKHQTMIDENLLPGQEQRLDQASLASRLLQDAGYQAIGIDHFARPDDTLAVAAREGGLKRNFQGYTNDEATALLGLGASSISQLPQGYAQNSPATADYMRRVDQTGLATVRGFELSADDRARSWVIERLMCDFGFEEAALKARFGALSLPIFRQAAELAASEGTIFRYEEGFYQITSEGRPFTRMIATQFDSYFGKGPARHSVAV
ncbi:oxygen-independent coproporphyrinogen III oxidase [Hoeflea sp. CAU 1731]